MKQKNTSGLHKEDFFLKGITRRWLLDIIGIVVIVVTLFLIICSVFVYNYYYNTVRQDITSRISMCSDFKNNNASASPEEFEIAAKGFIDSYSGKNAIEVQAFNSEGDIIVTTRGFIPQQSVYEDYTASGVSENGIAEWLGENANGESVFASTMRMPKYNGVSIGALRFVVSTERIDRQIIIIILVFLCVGLFIIGITLFSGVMFLKSILVPVRAITNTAFRIASGNFDDRLPVKGDDEIGKLCETINYMASELSSTEKLKNDFVSSVSHELRTPLTVIKGWGETVKSTVGVDDEMTKKGVDVIIGEAERLSGLVEDLLDFSRMQAGRLALKVEKIDILAELGEAVYMYQGIAAQNGIELEYIEPKQLPPVMADPSRLKQVFINIIDNAIKYSEKGGHILVEASQHDIYDKVTVSDMGCGIAAQDLSKVKEKFYKANTTVRGSGIGLAIADEIIKQHDGVLMIDSKEGAGTTVSIALPFIKTTDAERSNDE